MQFELAGLIGMNFVMRDKKTDSRWQQATGECFEGEFKGKKLKMIPFLLTTWGAWRAQHPNSLVLAPIPEFERMYERMARMTEGASGRRFRPRARLIREDDRMPMYEEVIGIEATGRHKAYRLADLKEAVVVNDQVGAQPVLLVHGRKNDTVTAFSRKVGSRVLTFKPAGPSGAALVDEQTGSRWNAYGECLDGKLKGTKLEVVIPLPSFWFSWAEFFPKTEIYGAGGKL